MHTVGSDAYVDVDADAEAGADGDRWHLVRNTLYPLNMLMISTAAD
jgi:hypothetical protein